MIPHYSFLYKAYSFMGHKPIGLVLVNLRFRVAKVALFERYLATFFILHMIAG